MTVQVPDYLLLGGTRLSVYFRSHLPDSHIGISAATDDKVAMLAVPTSNRRGYVGTWQFMDRRLQLVTLEGNYVKRSKAPLFGFWISDTLQIPMGELLRSASLTHHVPLCAQELRLSIDGGCLTRAVLIDIAAACPARLLANFRKQNMPWRRLYGNQAEPTVPLEHLEGELGVIERSSPPADWWRQLEN
jgi:hypothetical protein